MFDSFDVNRAMARWSAWGVKRAQRERMLRKERCLVGLPVGLVGVGELVVLAID